MPVIVKLNPDEVRTERNKGKSQRQIVGEQYDAMLEGFSLGDWGEVRLDEDEKRATVRNRLKKAAERRGHGIHFRRGQGTQMRFEIVEKTATNAPASDADDLGVSSAQDEPISSEAPPKRGRKKRNPDSSGESAGPRRRTRTAI